MNDAPQNSNVVSAVLGSFFLTGGKEIGEDRAPFEVSLNWQQLGALADSSEPHGTLAGMPLGYMAELLGRAAAAGEQLGLALTAVRDAEVWVGFDPDRGDENRRVIAGRALAEASGLWAVSTGHAVTNVVARVIRAHKRAVHLDKAFGWAGPPLPFVEERHSNLSLNLSTVSALKRAAGETREQALRSIVEPLDQLVGSAAWLALVTRRDLGYHRWRPQSVDGGALTTNPWVDQGDGTSVLSIGMSSGHVPPDIGILVRESRAGYDTLSSAMATILQMLPMAMQSSGIGIWHVGDAPT